MCSMLKNQVEGIFPLKYYSLYDNRDAGICDKRYDFTDV